jgi:hypothetical protein
MVHLAVAVELHGGIIPTSAFLLGSLAPDAIHMREGAKREDKRQTHFPPAPGEADDRSVRRLFREFAGDSRDRADFAAGYIAHILTDRIWSQTVYPVFLSRIAPDLDPAEIRRLYYRDTDQLDFGLYRQASWRPAVWAQLAMAQSSDFAGILTGEEIAQWRNRTLHWFADDAVAPEVRPSLLTVIEIQGFVVESAKVIAERFAVWQADVGTET